MPVSTRQATPGPSNRDSTTSQPVNTRKRAGSEGHDGVRDSKKMRIDGEALSQISSVSAKDKKKKKRKKKKRISVVKSDSEVKKPTRAKSGSVPLSPTKRKATVSSGESIPSNETKDRTDDEAEEERAISSSSDKGKGKAKSAPGSPSQRAADLESQPAQPVASGSTPPFVDSSESTSQASEMALLKEKLAAQTKLLERHQMQLWHQQQSLTCQICLDLMYKPYALSPCGHITCYGCLVRWFTAPQNPEAPLLALGNGDAANAAPQEPDTIESILNSDTARNGSYMRRRKKCPVCRAVVVERPVEMWGIKDMVSALIRSNLVDLPPAPIPTPPTAEEGANADPWRNVFRRAGSLAGSAFAAFFPFAAPAEPREQDDRDREQMGWFDAEDGGIHRCIDCYHEIWDGICSACHRPYPGHGGHNDDDDDDDDDDDNDDDGDMYLRHFRQELDLDTDESEDGEDYFRLFEREHIQAIEEELRARGELSEDDDDEGDNDVDVVVDVHDLRDLNYISNPFQFHPPGNDIWGAGAAQIAEVDDDEDDEEESDYGGSFINDDDDNDVEVVEGPSRSLASIGRRRYVQVESEEEEEEEGEEPDDVVDIDEDEDEDEDITAFDHARRRRVAPRRIMDDSDSGGDTEIDVDADDDVNEDEDPTLALDTGNADAVFGVYVSSCDEEEDSDGSAGWW